ncbi:MAG TPA: hypothetical protein VN176_18270 [Verrucomicrobiae bacterium]|jgi:hypothetical protein|nr:hypothetical protein [Verrucomicrobiae bacterium]
MAAIRQRHINPDELSKFLKGSIEPLDDGIYGNRYRAAVRLLDGTHLPCVVFQSRKSQVELALRRFDQLRSQPSQYNMVVETFVAGGSRIDDYQISAVGPSPYAWPLAILKQIHGETVMSWTAFVVEMKDGTMYSYGTSFCFEFFDIPEGYSYSDIAKIRSGMLYSQGRGLQAFSLDHQKQIQPYREKPFFTCYLKQLDSLA